MRVIEIIFLKFFFFFNYLTSLLGGGEGGR